MLNFTTLQRCAGTALLVASIALRLAADTADHGAVIENVKAIVLVNGIDQFKATGLSAAATDSSSVDISRVPGLNDEQFISQLNSFIGHPASLAQLDTIRQLTKAYLQSKERPFVDVSIPAQDVSSGVVQVVITEYRLGHITVQGAHHFSPALINRLAGFEPGQEITMDDMQTGLDRVNRNPFLNVDAVFKPGSQPGDTDLTLSATDRLPIRIYTGYDTLGVRSLGIAEMNYGVNWGNVFGTGQILSYQFTRSLSGRVATHSISDTIPLPWGDQLLIFGSFSGQRPQMAQIFSDQGSSGQASIRYAHVLPRTKKYTEQIELGYDFKTTNNNLNFAGWNVFSGQAETDQFVLVYDSSLTSTYGSTSVQNTLVFSPGGITPDNTTNMLAMLFPGAKAHYIYNRFSVTHTAPLTRGFSSVSRISTQVSNNDLPYPEQIGGGGVGSVRGYYTDTAFGSRGQIFNQELRFPSLHVIPMLNQETGGEKLQFGVFFDYARLEQQTPGFGADSAAANLASTGVLARYSITHRLDIQYDLGQRLHRTVTVPTLGTYGQVSITGSF